jgi:hypothetical protein
MDIDGDGHPDLVSGSWPGEIFLFRGTADHAFAAPEMLQDKKGEFINIGGGIAETPEGITITGNAEFDPSGEFVTYRGKRMENTPEKPLSVTGTASVVSVADWDGDGNPDLVVGNIDGDVYLIRNEGTPKSYAFGKEVRLQANGGPVHVESRAGPCVADWDGDGDLDLLVGAEDGTVSLYCNIGTRTAPKLAAPVQIVGPKTVSHPGTRSKVCVADWNGDGKPDLLIGDFVSQKASQPALAPEEKAKLDQVRKELEPLRQRYGQLIQELYGSSRVRTREARDKLNEEMKQLRARMPPLESQLPREYENHGWVWLFVRK